MLHRRLVLFLILAQVLPWSWGWSAETEMRVLIWNVERGANHFDRGPEKALAVIKESQATLVLMQESYDIDGDRPNLGAWIATQLDWKSYQGGSPHLCILTKHPILETFTHEPWHGVGARIRTPLGELLAWSCWLDYRAYLPYYLAKHPEAPMKALLDLDRKHSGREMQVLALIERLRALGHLDSDLPLLLGGDWNTPSHLDYVESTKQMHHGRVIPIPTTIALEKTGFKDTFRVVHPDPLKKPGITWSPLARRDKETGKPSPLDRIDHLYLKGEHFQPTEAITFPLALEEESIPKVQRRFPSDHSAVLVTLNPLEK